MCIVKSDKVIHISDCDKLFAEAANLYVEQKYGNYPSEEDILKKHPFSARHEAKMKRMFEHHDNIFYLITATLRRQLVTAAVILLIFSNVTVFVFPAIREPVIAFFTQIYEEFTDFIFSQNSENLSEIKERFLPAYIPDGYTEMSRVDELTFTFIVYTDQNKNENYFHQRLNDGSAIGLDTEDAFVSNISINNYSGKLIEKTIDMH